MIMTMTRIDQLKKGFCDLKGEKGPRCERAVG